MNPRSPLPVLALLIGAFSLFATTPTQAQNELTGLSLSVGGNALTLSPAFAASTSTYTTTVAHDATSVSLTATWSGTKTVFAHSETPALQGISSATFSSSGSSVSLNLNSGGVTNIDIAIDQTSTYTITVNRSLPEVQSLSLSLSSFGTALTLSPAFASSTRQYTTTVAHGIIHVNLTASWSGSEVVGVTSEISSTQPITTATVPSSGSVVTLKLNPDPGGSTNIAISIDQIVAYNITVNRSPAPAVSLSVRSNPVEEGSTVTVDATVFPKPFDDFIIPLIVSNGTSETTDWWPRGGKSPPADGRGLFFINVSPGRQNFAHGLRTFLTHQDSDHDDETFIVELDTANLPGGFRAGTPSRVTVQITDPDESQPHIETVRLHVDDYVAEGDSLSVTAILSSPPVKDRPLTIPLTVTKGTSEDGDHGTLTNIRIPANQCCSTGYIQTNADSDDEDETFTVGVDTVNLTSLLRAGDPSSVEVTIYEGDTPPAERSTTTASSDSISSAREIVVGNIARSALVPGARSESGSDTGLSGEDPDNALLVNIATRALVGMGTNIMFDYFTIKGGPKMVLIQAVGPELNSAKARESNALADPVLTVVRRSDGAQLTTNDDWEDSQKQEITDAWGGSPNLLADSKSAAAILTLPPGDYTAIVSGKNGTTGVAQVEVYDLD